MIADFEALPPDQRPLRLLMIRFERFGRGDGLEAMDAFLQIRKLNIIVHTRLDGDVGAHRASELLMPVLRFFIGGMENEVRRDKLVSMYERRREARKDDPSIAISPKPAYGLTYENGHLLPQEPEAGAVRLAYALKSQGYGTYTIGKRLSIVAPPMVLKNGEHRPQKWTADRVRKLIIKESYRGTIVDDDLWYRAQRPAREVNRPTRRLEHPLSGALRCECGTALVGQKGSGKRSCTYQYYRCPNYLAHDGKMKHHRSDLLEAQFVAILQRLTVDDALIESFLTAQRLDGDADALGARLTRLRSERDRFDERRRALFSAYEEGALDRSDLQWRLDDLGRSQTELEERISHIERDLATMRSARSNLADIKALLAQASENWPKAAIDDRRALAKAIARALGGFFVTMDSKLNIGSSQKHEVMPGNPRLGRRVNGTHRESSTRPSARAKTPVKSE